MNEILIKILFVCFGNICRSPAAEGVMNHLLRTEYKDLRNNIAVDSCGTSDLNSGNSPDRRMREEALKRGIRLDHHSRSITLNDLKRYDLIIAMDDSNYHNIIFMGGDKNKVKKMIDYVEDKKGCNEIPDPYYGGSRDFNLVLDLLEDGCKGIIKSLIELYNLKHL